MGITDTFKDIKDSCTKLPQKCKNSFNNACSGWAEVSQWVNTALHIPFEERLQSCPAILMDSNIHLAGMVLGLFSLVAEILRDRDNMKNILSARRIQVGVTFSHFWIWGQAQWGPETFPCIQYESFTTKYYFWLIILFLQSDWIWFSQFLMALRHVEFWLSHPDSIDTAEFKPWFLAMLQKPDQFCQWLSQYHYVNIIVNAVWKLICFVFGLFPDPPTEISYKLLMKPVPQNLVDLIAFPLIWYAICMYAFSWVWKKYGKPVWDDEKDNLPDLATTPYVGWIYAYLRDDLISDIKALPKTIFEWMKNHAKVWIWMLILWLENAADWIKLFGIDTIEMPEWKQAASSAFSFGTSRKTWGDAIVEFLSQAMSTVQTYCLDPLVEMREDSAFLMTPFVAGIIMGLILLCDTLEHRVTN